mmetsp:Transcript_14593/g.39042  ORF Transcript_14593/g.39042 Transcript_14593/m.39042 type:complete len:546 (+) Transcript_14593:111-1748(+)|eukprot:CAMPEP_0185833852 /NCGR_PEP_ID=MMETSP1353-20130828/3597_1 /TAXON_ID=1077150 /ORGANISM="Erythrolobus australicus, Strain CCMP3124" /LENGTH=545 /DNA_ID=CAMNT_0028532187 /DNA_START=108 /DNA_END=1745 /DNA_ORIENTATION=-
MNVGKRGVDLLRSNVLNRGTGFTAVQRDELGIRGLLPPRVTSLNVQVERALEMMRRQQTDLDKYVFLQGLLGRNERLFFRLVMSNIVETMPLIYTPVVGAACQNWGHIFQATRGMYISYEDKGSILRVLNNWPEDDVRVIVVTDGERILGLGDLGCYGMGIPIGKLLLYNGCGGVDPRHTLPIQLDTGCNTPGVRNDPYYCGLDMDRVRGKDYDEFIDEFVQAVQQRFSTSTLIQFEDFAQANAARLLAKYQYECCTFNDDIQGTAAVALAGIFSALRLPGVQKDLSEHRFLFYGAGSAGIGIADLIVADLVTNKGLSRDVAKRSCWFLDSKGLIYAGRANLTEEKEKYAHENPPHLEDKSLLAAVRALKPTAIIGVSTIPNSFDSAILKEMCNLNERPIVFALSNPTSKAECTAEACYRETNGRAVFASGSPFAPVTLEDGREFVPGQGNNSYIFPAVGLAVCLVGAKHVSDLMFLESAKALALQTTDEDLAKECVYPPLTKVQTVSAYIAYAVCKQAEKEGLATRPVPDSAEDIEKRMYDPSY